MKHSDTSVSTKKYLKCTNFSGSLGLCQDINIYCKVLNIGYVKRLAMEASDYQ